ncbi:MAG: DUF4233 domain-containing protein [Rhodococcus sp. (in: high G+C Gram-positive bacteria)]|uniref:DUF4233 domain-containing protein n=1 Tax=Rhodococcus sp. TaxID=1831 RepID=UPI003BAFB57E
MSASDSNASNPEVGPPVKDPWKGFRGVVAGTLVLEGIVVLLALPVVATVGGGVTWASGIYVVGLAVLMFLGAGLQGRPWAMKYNLLLQVVLVLGFFVHVSIGVVGVVFAILWGYLLYFRKSVREKMERGLLPGQRD